MQAVILAAGIGRRLGDITRNKPKCMVSINGRTIIENALEALKKAGIERVILVTGHAHEKLESFVREMFPELNFEFVYNKEYASTNNIYSLYLARDFLLEEDSILLESDVFFERSILTKLLNDRREVLAVVDKYQPWMDGTVVKVDEEDNITAFIPKEFFDYEEADEYYKTVNIYKFSKEFIRDTYLPFLKAYVEVMGKNAYYELVLRVISFLEKANVKALRLEGEKWYEIDTLQDIKNAEVVFATSPELKLKKVKERYGGYWRFPKIKDFCYLVNPYFPTKKMYEEIKASFDTLSSQYPSTLKVQNLLAGMLFGVDEDDILVGNGASELIASLPGLLPEPVGVILPTFEEYPSRFKNVIAYTSDSPDYRYGVEDLLRLAKLTGTIVLVNPDNPSGNYINRNEILYLLEELKRRNKYLVLDESFVDFSCEGDKASLIRKDILYEFPNLIVVKSISKSYGVPGLRLGVLATSNRELLKVLRGRLPVWNINSFGEFFLQIFPKYVDEYRKACDKVREERERFYKNLKKLPILRVIPSEANYFMCELKEGLRAKDFVSRMLWEKDIFVKDLSSKKGVKGEFIRVAIRDSKDNDYFIKSVEEIYS